MTAKSDIQKMVDDYWKWMRDRTVLMDADNDWVEINPPFMDRHNDGLQLYVKKIGEKYRITDDSYALSDLTASGVNIKTSKRAEVIGEILRSYGISENEGQLSVDTAKSEYPCKMNNIIQAILEIGGLHSTASDRVMNYFIEDVSIWLDSKGVRGNKYANITGSSGVSYRVDFLLPGDKISDTSFTAIQTLSTPDKQSFATKVALPLLDIGKVRRAKFIVIVNDKNLKGSTESDLKSIMDSSNIETVFWSRRDEWSAEA